MTKLLQQAFNVASELPEEQQDMVAQVLLDEMESERKWDELFSRPESEEPLNRMAEETLAEHRAGLTQPLSDWNRRR